MFRKMIAEQKGGFMHSRYSIPDGYTMEQIVSMAEQKLRTQRNEYNRTHPEIVKQQRIRAYSNYLRKNGLLVMDVNGIPQPPWDELTGRSILNAIRANIGGLRDE